MLLLIRLSRDYTFNLKNVYISKYDLFTSIKSN